MTRVKLGRVFSNLFSASIKNGYPCEMLTIMKGLIMILFLDIVSNSIRFLYLHREDSNKYFELGISIAGIVGTAVPSTIAFCLFKRLEGMKKRVVCIGIILFILVGFYEVPLQMGAEIEIIYIKYYPH